MEVKMKTKIKNKSNFILCLGEDPRIKVLDFLITFQMFDYPLTEIARKSHVSYNSLKSFFPYFIKTKMICKTRRVGKSDYYKLNTDDEFIKKLLQIDWDLTKPLTNSNNNLNNQ